MNMLKETIAVLKQVEETSDTPVKVLTDPSLPTYASIKIARGASKGIARTGFCYRE